MRRPLTHQIGAPVAFPPTMPVGGLGHTAYQHVGATGGGNYVFAAGDDTAPSGAVSSALSLVPLAIAGAAAYHGYKRTNSVGWAVGWFLLARLSPVITGAVAIAQGFGKRKGG